MSKMFKVKFANGTVIDTKTDKNSTQFRYIFLTIYN